jgi:hypothetical protein
VFSFQSVKSIVIAPAKTGNDNSNSKAVIATAHTNNETIEFEFLNMLIIIFEVSG